MTRIKEIDGHRRERWGIVAHNPRSLGGLIEAARHFGGKWARQLCHKLNTPQPPLIATKPLIFPI